MRRKRKPEGSLHRKINRRLLPFLLVAFVTIGLLLSAQNYKTHVYYSDQEAARMTELYVGAVDSILMEYVHVVRMLSGNKSLCRVADKMHEGAMEYGELLNLYLDDINMLFEPYYTSDQCVRLFIDSNQIHSDGRYVVPRNTFIDEVVFQQVLGEGVLSSVSGETWLFRMQENRLCTLICAPVLNDLNEPVALLTMVVSNAALQKRLIELKPNCDRLTITTHDGGVMVADGESYLDEEDIALSMECWAGQELFRIRLEYTRDTLYGAARSQLVGSVVIIASLALIFVLMANSIVTATTQRLRLLRQKLETGPITQYVETVTLDKGDEITLLENTFSLLMRKEMESREQALAAAEERRRLENQMLRAQFNPHFLYNSLSMIRWGVMHDGNQELAEDIQKLVSFYRNMLSGDREFVRLEKEIDTMRMYVQLHTSVYGKQVRVQIQAPPETMDTLLPRMILQPLVENSLKHGLPDSEEGVIDIEVHIEKGMLYLTVVDNGEGVDDATLDRLNGNEEPGNASYGVYSTARRLKLMYGECAQLHFAHNRPSGLRVQAIFPAVPTMFAEKERTTR